jgi:putative SOS response-associated peptidase YedK
LPGFRHRRDATALLHPAAGDTLRVWPVGTRVNRPADGADLLAPGAAG